MPDLIMSEKRGGKIHIIKSLSEELRILINDISKNPGISLCSSMKINTYLYWISKVSPYQIDEFAPFICKHCLRIYERGGK